MFLIGLTFDIFMNMRIIICLILSLLLMSKVSNSQCIVLDNVTASPAPVSGTYQPGQTITFTYTISAYNGLSVNYLHGIIPTFTGGWDMTTISPVGIPTNNTGNGVWLWVNSVTSSQTGITVIGPGWFYDSSSGGPLDGNPGNNWGDGMNSPWTFQFSITVGQCPPSSDGDPLNLTILNFADGETGSWINYDCQNDPNETFSATLECCPIIVTQPITHN